MGDRARRWTGWTLLTWATILEHTVAKKETWLQRQARRNTALCGADKRGVPLNTMAKWLGAEENSVRQMIKKGNGQPTKE